MERVISLYNLLPNIRFAVNAFAMRLVERLSLLSKKKLPECRKHTFWHSSRKTQLDTAHLTE